MKDLTPESKAILKLLREAKFNACMDLVVSMRTPVTYTQLGNAIGLFAGAAELARFLGKRMERDVSENKPLACALVVNNMGQPGEGFFMAAKYNGFEFDDTSEKEREAFWQAQVRRFNK